MYRHHQVLFRLFFVLLMLISMNLLSQPVDVNLYVDPNPPLRIYEWQSNPQLIRLDANNPSPDIMYVRMRATVFNGAGDVVLETVDFESPVLPLLPGMNNMYPLEVLTANAINYMMGDLGEIVRTTMIPEGEYVMCVQLINAELFEPVSEEACSYFFIQGFEPPFLTFPVDGASFNGENYYDIVFKWTPVQSFSDVTEINYRFALTEIIEGQAPWEALLENPPLYESLISNENFLIWPMDLTLPRLNQKYVWAVQLSGIAPEIMNPEEGWSEPFVFTVNDEFFETGDSSEVDISVDFTDESSESDDLWWPDSSTDFTDSTTVSENDSSLYEEEEPFIPGTEIVTGDSTMIGDSLNFPGDIDLTDSSLVDTPTTNTGTTTTSADDAGGGPIIHGGGDETGPGNGGGLIFPADTTKMDTSRVPGEDIPPYDLINTCKAMPLKREAGASIEVGVLVDAIMKYPYPRAVPIRVEAKDLDYAIFECEGCNDGKSDYYNIVEDIADKVSWKLKGHGSLNVPFSAEDIDSIDTKIEEMHERIEVIKDSIKWHEEKIEKLPEKISDADTLISQQEQRIEKGDSVRSALRDRNNEIKDSLKTFSTDISAIQSKQKEKSDSLSALVKEADSIRNFLSGAPSEEMELLLEDIDVQKEAFDLAKEDVNNRNSAIFDATKEGMKGIREADSLLQLSIEDYNKMKASTEEISEQIIDLENKMYSGKGMRTFMKAKREWELSVFNVMQFYLDQQENSSTGALQANTAKAARKVLVERKSENRPTLLNDFSAELQKLNNQLASYKNKSTECSQDVGKSINESRNFSHIIDSLSQSSFYIDVTSSVKADSLRNELKAMEADIEAAKKVVQELNEEYVTALEDYQQEIEELELEKQDALENLEAEKKDLAELESEYQRLSIQLQDSIRNNKMKCLEEIEEKQKSIAEINQRISNFTDSLSVVYADSLKKATELDDLQKEIKIAVQDSTTQQSILKNYKKVKKTLQDRLEASKDRLAELQEELKDLEEEIPETEAKKQQEFLGKKTAKGEIVYYIPPPLEEIMKEKEKFEELKEKVTLCEDSLNMALENKKMVQLRLAKIIEKIGKKIAKHAELTASIDSLEQAKKEAETDLNKAKNDVAHEYQDKQQELQDKIESADSLMKAAARKQEELETKKSELKTSIDNVDKLVVQRDSSVARAERAIKKLLKEINELDEEIISEQETIRSYSGDLEVLREELSALEISTGRANNKLTRAYASKHDKLKKEAKEEIDKLKDDIKEKETAISKKEKSLSSKSSALKTKQINYQTKQKDLVDKRKDLQGEKIVRRAMRDSLFALHESYKKTAEGVAHWKKAETLAKKNKEETEAVRKEFQRVVADSVSANDKVQGKKAALENIDKSIDDAKEGKDELVTYINEQLPKKDKIIAEADERLEHAKKQLEDAEKELKEFLLKEFQEVNFNAELEITVDDRVIGICYNDNKVVKSKFIRYENDRIPVFANERPQSALSKQSHSASCVASAGGDSASEPGDGNSPSKSSEPRTIALVFKNGKPLWENWPVFHDNKLLAKDMVTARSPGFTDMDKLTHFCEPTTDDCRPPAPKDYFPVDPGDHTWQIEGLTGFYPLFQQVTWEPGEVPVNQLEREIPVKIKYDAQKIFSDPPAKAEGKFIVKPGVLIEIPDTVFGVPESTEDITARTVKGDHKALNGEEIEFSLERIAGYAEDYGFNGSDSLLTLKTKDGGYAIAPFNFGKGFARFRIHIKWMRNNQVVEKRICIAESPIRLQMLRFNTGPNTKLWEKAIELVSSGETVSNATLETFAKENDTSLADDSTGAVLVHAVAGLLDYNYDFVKEKQVKFEAESPAVAIPDTAETREFGMARVEIEEIPDSTKLKTKCLVEDKYAEVGRPSEDELQFSTEKLQSFQIGSEGEEGLFTINLEEAVSPGEEIKQNGSFDTEGLLGWIIELAELELRVNNVELEDGIAIAGSVSYASEAGVSISIPGGFEIKLDSLAIEAGAGLGIGGEFIHKSIPAPVEFSASVDKNGNFLGTVSKVPDIEVAGFKLKEGSSFTLDISTEETPIATLESKWKGLIINSCTLQMPEIFNGNEGTTPTTLSAEDLYIGSAGVGGKVALEGSFLNLEYSGYGMEVSKLAIEFANDSLINAEIAGKMSLGLPFEGSMETTISYGGNSWAAEVSTETPISIPRIGTTFSLMSETGIYYSEEEDIATFRMNAVAKSDDFGEITVQGVEVNSEGKIKADNISVSKTIKVGSGFTLQLDSLGFKYEEGDLNLRLNGGFGLPLIGLDQMKGKVIIAPGPTFDAELNSAEISFENDPVKFKGKFEFASNEFKGQFAINIEKLKPLEGIEGMIVVGNRVVSEEEIFTYWYAEMIMNGQFMLGNSGVMLLSLGGGVGYNYRPPIGQQTGSPTHNDSFAFKALIALGSAPEGEIVKGRMEMVLMPGLFSLYGKVWALEKEESMYGDGQLSLYWGDQSKVDGYVGMFIGIPDSEGDIFYFRGKVNFLYSEEDTYIRSEEIKGAFMKKLNAEAHIDINKEKIDLGGRLYYNYNDRIDVALAYLVVALNVDAGGSFLYEHKSRHLNAKTYFHGDWDVDLDTKIGDFDVVSGEVKLELELDARPTLIYVDGKAKVSWDTWIHSGSKNLEVGFRESL